MTGAADSGVRSDVRVLLVDDQELVRSGLRRILRRRDGFVIAGECADGSDVPAALAAGEVDVIVMDLRMKVVDGIEATRRLRQSGSHPPVLALTTFDDDELLAGALRAGATGYVLKDSPAEDLIRAVRAVAAGDAWLDAAVTARVLTTYRRAAPEPDTGPAPERLTPREHDVLRAIGRGLTNAEIATTLMISELTVKSHISRIFTKLGLRDRAAAIVYAFDHGIVSPSQGGPDFGDLPTEPALTRRPVINQRPPATIAVAPVSVASPRLRLAVLGPLRAWRGHTRLDLGPVRQQALLAALALCPDVTVSQRELLDRVWGQEPPGTGGKVVPVYVHRLRRCLQDNNNPADPVIDRDRGGYRFVSRDIEMDSARLAELVAEVDTAEQAGDLAAAVAACSCALALFEGEPLAGLPGPFAAGERSRLSERGMALSLRKLDWQLRLGRHPDAIGELSALSQAHPHSEPVAALLMRALYGSGRRVDALTVFTRLRHRLVADLGVEPGEQLRRVQQAVLRGDNTGLTPAGQG
jgi:DNA-binding NarL/FixJ family response regulator/DNA-binding SARP family transcriptional activator